MSSTNFDDDPQQKINTLIHQAGTNLNSAVDQVKTITANTNQDKQSIGLSAGKLLLDGQNNLKSISLELIKQQGGELIKISHNSVNHSYLEIFGKYLDDCNVVELSDPELIKNNRNLRCFHAFIEVLIIKKVKYLFIVTRNNDNTRDQKFKQNFDNIIKACRRHNIFIQYDTETTSNRQFHCEKSIKFYQSDIKLNNIIFDPSRPSFPDIKTVLENCKNFFTVKLHSTYGLNYFQPPDYNLVNENQWQPGFQNYSLKPCWKVDIMVSYTKWKEINALQLGLFNKTYGEMTGNFDEIANMDGQVKFFSEEGRRECVSKIEKYDREILITVIVINGILIGIIYFKNKKLTKIKSSDSLHSYCKPGLIYPKKLPFPSTTLAPPKLNS